jgi:Glycosyl transferase family 2
VQATVICPVRNEGPFLVDWVVWYRMLGFTDIVILTNDCTDHTLDLLEAFKLAGWLEYQDCVVPAKRSIYITKMRLAAEMKAVRRANWVLVCDIDEYLVIHRGAGLLPDLIGTGTPDFLGMALNWRVFSSSGIETFEDIPVHQQFFGATPLTDRINLMVKTVFAHPRWFEDLRDHGPQRLNLKKAESEVGVSWGTRPLVWVNGGDKVLDYWEPQADLRRALLPDDQDYTLAQMNHYMLRSAETFGLKRGTKSPSAGEDRYNQKYWDRANKLSEIDVSALRYEPEFTTQRARAMALPGVAALHYQCCADHVRLIAEKAGRRAEDDPRYHDYLAKSAAAK